MTPTHWLLAAAAGAVFLGSLGPWVTLLGFSAAGTEGDGVLTLMFSLGAAGALWRIVTSDDLWPAGAVIAAGGLSFAVALYDYFTISNGSNLDSGNDLARAIGEAASPGWGLYLVLLGSVGLVAAGLSEWNRRRQPSPVPPTF